MDWRLLTSVLIGVGWRLAVPMVGLTLLGVWLDGRFGTRPWLALVGLGLGIVIGYYAVYRLLLPIMKEAQKGKKDKDKGGNQ